jgi:hypothetical protein
VLLNGVHNVVLVVVRFLSRSLQGYEAISLASNALGRSCVVCVVGNGVDIRVVELLVRGLRWILLSSSGLLADLAALINLARR